ncbi:MAG: hypothetical protein JWQ89_101 [Devosia sp.]|uniref:hypothetical protein n=1 Tax=Devosia sp. TaxID=1871048 RepID=UPI00261AC617|nr:hypothetical protein [Devosia sp.]MDB5538374.1 hypothetical protein [Devosia sp.]
MAQDVEAGEQKDLVRLQARQQLFVLSALIVIYAAVPTVMAADFILQLAFGRASSLGAPTIDANALVQFVNPLASAKGSVLEALHKLILPLAALFLGANFAMLRNGRLSAWLFLIPLVGTVSALLAASLLDAFQSAEMKVKYTGLPTLFRDVASNLGIVMMLLIGHNLGKQQ